MKTPRSREIQEGDLGPVSTGKPEPLIETLRRIFSAKLSAGDSRNLDTLEELIEIEEELRANPPAPIVPPLMVPGKSAIGWYIQCCDKEGDLLHCESCTPKPHGGPRALGLNIYPVQHRWQLDPNVVPVCTRCGGMEP